jgi:wyosine [tRNA(Phe)-imidazoG37] synthetase (radical SAM superfamily)
MEPHTSTIYGPVASWRFGWSLGVDLILSTSACSFDCVYCQLGPIRVRTNERREFQPTQRVLSDLEAHEWQHSEIVTFAGSGEPTLASNLGEAIAGVARITRLPSLVLTNGTQLHDEAARRDLLEADRVEIKLDAADEATFLRVNRPVEGVTLEGVVSAAAAFRQDYGGHLSLQVMMLPMERDYLAGVVRQARRISPDSISLTTPRRPRPSDWYLPARGSHGEVPYPARPMRQPRPDECLDLARQLADESGVEVWVSAGEKTVIRPR